MSRKLDDLTSVFRPKVFELLARLCERQIAVMIVDTLRTPEEHKANLAKGVSKAVLSYHLPRHMRSARWTGSQFEDSGKSDAIDLCPYAEYYTHGNRKLNWDPKNPQWAIIGEEAERLGLGWGGRWTSPFDPGHIQLPNKFWL